MKKNCQWMFAGTACDRPQTGRKIEQSATDTPALRYRALVIGIGDYAGTGWPKLGTSVADAEALSEVLYSKYGFETTTLTDRQATRGNILRTLDQLMTLDEHDALLIYFAGHGYYDEQMDEGYWIPFGAKRLRNNQPAKEDWLWNSSLNRILEASPARHILLIADTCYGGSLFRGEPSDEKSAQWYERAMSIPSRYLITSGNLEPVLDSGIRHSIFAQELLNFLNYTDQDVFAASDIAVAIRSKVSRLTGQLVRMGPMNSQAHAGGEFVFVRAGSSFAAHVPEPDNAVFRNAPINPLQHLKERIDKSSASGESNLFVRPRILACLGPVGESPEETAMVRSRLYSSLNDFSGCVLVERKAFDALLEEVELGSSELADQRVAMEIGKLLPASLIIFGDIIPIGNNREIHLRVVDTETSRVLTSAYAAFQTASELDTACRTLAEKIMQTLNRARPLLFRARQSGNGTLVAGWGRFHGARVGDTFEIISRENTDTVAPRETVLGTARLLSLDEEQSVFQTQWNIPGDPQASTLWLRASR